MTGLFWLDWASLALSLTNTILLIWLGTTVLINVEERSWGGWLAAAGLYLGGIFFVSHTAILGYGLSVVSVGTALWWVVGLIAVTVLPLLWYVMMLWYSGFWEQADEGGNSLRQRHRVWLGVSAVALVGMLAAVILMERTPVSAAYPVRGLEESPVLYGIPVMVVLYPAYVIVCMGLSLDAVRHPGPTNRLMGEQARQHARPWLVASSLSLLLVSFSVVGVFVWLYPKIPDFQLSNENIRMIGYFDVLIEALIAAAVVMVGQAVVAYEIFTGQSLPRRGFLRQWQYAVLLAFGFGAVIGFVFSTNLRPIYGILLATLMMTFFLAMFSWRTVSERQRSIRRLRPFVTSQGFYDQLVAGDGLDPEEDGLTVPFRALCQEVLDTEEAYLVALGPLAPLAGETLHYHRRKVETVAALPEGIDQYLMAQIGKFRIEDPILPVEQAGASGVDWVVPLWSQRGVAGALLLGPKRDGGIYSREEIEVAQSSGERLIDARASAEIARKLLGMQRQRLAQTQVLDQRTRRALHDDILQDLHAAILRLAGEKSMESQTLESSIGMLTEVHADISRLLRSLPGTSLPDLPALGLIGALRALVRDEIGARFDGVSWQISPEAEAAAESLSPLEEEVLYYAAREAMRNAARHGRPEDDNRHLNLSISIDAQPGFEVLVEDDGVGIPEGDKPDQEGGQGLSLHSTMMAVIGGELAVESEPGRFTRVRLKLGHLSKL